MIGFLWALDGARVRRTICFFIFSMVFISACSKDNRSASDGSGQNTPPDGSQDGDPAIILEKAGTYFDANGDMIRNSGDEIRYAFAVINKGNEKLTDIQVHDPFVEVSQHSIELDPGDSDTSHFKAVYKITADDVDRGGVYNLAKVSAKRGNGKVIVNESHDPNGLSPGDPNFNPDCPNCTYTFLGGSISDSDAFTIWNNDLWRVDEEQKAHPYVPSFDAPAGIDQYNGKVYVISGNGTNWNNTSRRWKLWVGTDIDHTAEQQTPQMAADFPNLTTKGNRPDECYYWPMGLWIDPANGVFYSLTHIEYDYVRRDNKEAHERRLGMMKSDDYGKTWAYLGDVLTQDTTILSAGDQVRSGVGDAHLFVAPDGFAYTFYKRGFYSIETLNYYDEEICVARCRIEDIGDPTQWRKFHNGKWEELGLGGRASVVMPTRSVHVAYSEYLKKYFMIGKVNEDTFISFATDLEIQDWSEINTFVPRALFSWYTWFYDPANQSDRLLGQDFRIYTTGVQNGMRYGYYHDVHLK